MRKVIIAIINGVAQSGKTTIQQKMIYLANNEIIDAEVRMMSSVDVPYKAMKLLGWNGVKDDQFRADMATLKEMYIRNCNGPTVDLIRTALEIACSSDNEYPCIITTDIREADEIKKVMMMAEPLKTIGIKCETVYVQRDAVDTTRHGNIHDDGIVGTRKAIKYGIIVNNNGDLDQIQKIALELAETLLEVRKDEEKND